MRFSKTDYTRITGKAVFVILLAGCVLAGCENTERAQQSRPVPEVSVFTVQTQKVALTTELPGRTAAFKIAEIRPQVSGIIKERLFREGSVVKEGQLLYSIDPGLFRAAYNSAAASLARAQAHLPATRSRVERYRELLSLKAVSRQALDDAESALNQAEAEVKYWEAAVESARINLRYTSVKAPIPGRTGKSNVTEGALVTANQPTSLVTVQQLDPIYVDIPQSTAKLLDLRRSLETGHLSSDEDHNKTITLLLNDGTAYPLKGALEFQDVTVERSTGTVTLRAVFPNPDNLLLPGMFVRAVVPEGVDNEAILVPQQAVSRDPKGNPLVLLANQEDTVEQRPITVDRAIGNQWLVTSGLSPGDRIIVEGIQNVRPGSPVRTVPAADTDIKPAAPEKTTTSTTPSN